MSDIVKKGNELINYFIARYQDAYGKRPLINKNTAKWAARDLIDSFDMDTCTQAIDWYFHVKDTGHSWNWFANNIERLHIARIEKEKDDEQRRVNRERARAWLNG